MKFSQKIGKTPVRTALQIESIDEVLKNKLWNNIRNDFFDMIPNYNKMGPNSDRALICKVIWEDFFEFRSDEIPSFSYNKIYVDGVINYIKEWFFKTEWYEQYDFIEFLSSLESQVSEMDFTQNCNDTLEKESAGYRIINQKIIQITSKEEILEIESAINYSNEFKPVEIHLRTSLGFLSNRENPDYRNSIKESISAVESLCVIMTGDKNTTLGQALTQIEKRYKLHGALKNAFSSLYGYASDSGGIRHSLLEDDIDVTMEDAKFMLVSCSAFINYLMAKKITGVSV